MIRGKLFVQYDDENGSKGKVLNTFSTNEERKSFHIDIETDRGLFVLSIYKDFFGLSKGKDDEFEIIFDTLDDLKKD